MSVFLSPHLAIYIFCSITSPSVCLSVCEAVCVCVFLLLSGYPLVWLLVYLFIYLTVWHFLSFFPKNDYWFIVSALFFLTSCSCYYMKKTRNRSAQLLPSARVSTHWLKARHMLSMTVTLVTLVEIKLWGNYGWPVSELTVNLEICHVLYYIRSAVIQIFIETNFSHLL